MSQLAYLARRLREEFDYGPVPEAICSHLDRVENQTMI
jgi:hypothetical protein